MTSPVQAPGTFNNDSWELWMTVVAPGLAIVAGPSIAEIECDEHESILKSLTKVHVQDLGEVIIRAGLQVCGSMVVLLNTMSGGFYLVGNIASVSLV
jgi:hypothetical protein